MDAVTFWDVLRWTLCAIALSPVFLGIGWEIVEGSILPRLIPRAEIERLADEVIAQFPDDPMQTVIDNEKTAWVKAESGEQAKWRRVGKMIQNKLA